MLPNKKKLCLNVGDYTPFIGDGQNIDLNSQLEQDSIEPETGKQSDYKAVSYLYRNYGINAPLRSSFLKRTSAFFLQLNKRQAAKRWLEQARNVTRR